MKAKLLYSTDQDVEKHLQPGDVAMNLSTKEILVITAISSGIFGNDGHLVKLTPENLKWCIKQGLTSEEVLFGTNEEPLEGDYISDVNPEC